MSRQTDLSLDEPPEDPGDHAVSGPIREFAAMVHALNRRDYQAATRHRRELYALGFSVVARVPGSAPSQPGARQAGTVGRTIKTTSRDDLAQGSSRLVKAQRTAVTPPSRPDKYPPK
jgi:hypothetical protein